MIRRRVLVSGTVQGVFFRDSCRRAAAEAGVAGWVRNLPDGRVEAVFEGEPAAVDRMVAWMRHGPSRAVVERVEVQEEQPEGLLVFAVTA
ncbi:acylphosphatase [Kitasatospora phosalacinea]|uniref:acylphosphatase n=1 Tax=Kitasatospora phosalacinea TaxID=2065 RepID=UPI0036685E71